jgi:hypothetical protein
MKRNVFFAGTPAALTALAALALGIAALCFSAGLLGCVSTPKTATKKNTAQYRILLDSSLESNSMVMAAWIGYTAYISNDMEKYYDENPDGDYVIPYDTEMVARNSLIDFYLRVQKEYKIHDDYIEDLIKLRKANHLNEYVFYSFNPGTWVNDQNYQEETYRKWLKLRMPKHIPLTLARVERIN